MTTIPSLSGNPFLGSKLAIHGRPEKPQLGTAPESKRVASTSNSDEAAIVNLSKAVPLPSLSYSPQPRLSSSEKAADQKKVTADYNGDGFVTGEDFDMFTQAFEKGDKSSDANGDGRIDATDREAFLKEFENP